LTQRLENQWPERKQRGLLDRVVSRECRKALICVTLHEIILLSLLRVGSPASE
jgi:hypothetical protein